MRIRLLAVVLFIFSVTISSCGGDDVVAPQSALSLSFIIDGKPFTAINADVQRSRGTITFTGVAPPSKIAWFSMRNGEFVIDSTAEGPSRSLSVAVHSTAAGTFVIGGADSPTLTYSEQPTNGSNALPAQQWVADAGIGSGTLVLTEVTARQAVGTFTATLSIVGGSAATASRSVTNGKFVVKF